MSRAKKPQDRRVTINPDEFAPEELLALSKICDPKATAVQQAREAVGQSRVFDVDVTVRVVGDIEVGVSEQVPERFDAQKYLVAALAKLSESQRKSVLARPVVRKSVAAAVRAEIEAVKGRLPTHPGPAKLTPHLSVTRLSRAEARSVPASGTGGYDLPAVA